jgi:hypothetical protein
VHRDADGARLVGDRTGDGLADPPGGIGGKLVAAAVLELVHRLHQADVAFLDQVEELQAAVGVFLGDGDDKAQVGLDHFLLGAGGVAFAALHRVHHALEFGQVEHGELRHLDELLAHLLDRVGMGVGECGPALLLQPLHPAQPVGVELVALLLLEEALARHAAAFGQAEKLHFLIQDAAVEAIVLVEQRLDAVVVEVDAAHLLGQLFLELLQPLFLRRRELVLVQGGVEADLEQLVDLLPGGGHRIEAGEHAGQQRLLHHRERNGVLAVFVVLAAIRRLAVFVALFRRGGRDRRRGDDRHGAGGRGGLEVGRQARVLAGLAAIGGVEIDDVAQQRPCLRLQQASRHSAMARMVIGLSQRPAIIWSRGRPRCAWRSRSRPRATAIRSSPSRADTYGPGRRCGRVLRLLGLLPRLRGFLAPSFGVGRGLLAALRRGFLGFLALDQVDAHLGEHGHRVLDLLRGHLFRRQRLVQLVIGDVAALLAARDELAQRRVDRVEQRAILRLVPFARRRRRLVFAI